MVTTLGFKTPMNAVTDCSRPVHKIRVSPAGVKFVRKVLALLKKLGDPDQEVEPVEVRDNGHQGHPHKLEVEASVKVEADHDDAHDGGEEGRHPGWEQKLRPLVDDTEQGDEVEGKEGERDDYGRHWEEATEDEELCLFRPRAELDYGNDEVDRPDKDQEERHDLGGEEGLSEHPEQPGR